MKRCSKCKKNKALDEFYSKFSYCKICDKKRVKLYHIKHRTEILEKQKEWRRENPHYMSKYQKIRSESDIQFKLIRILRRRLWKAFNNDNKSGSAIQDLGCSMSEFKKYLELKFKEGMTWDNYGKHGWHIDHIIPLSKFDLTKREELKKACHYTNLQPLWAEENLRKSNNI